MTQTNDPKEFAEGKDLEVTQLHAPPESWRLSLAKMAAKPHVGFGKLLMHENLVQPALMEEYKTKVYIPSHLACIPMC
jgi:hypothetical protein